MYDFLFVCTAKLTRLTSMRNTQWSVFRLCVEHLNNSEVTYRIVGMLGQGIGKSQQNSSEVLARVSSMNGRQERGRSCIIQKKPNDRRSIRIMLELSTTLSFILANSFRQKNPYSVAEN